MVQMIFLPSQRPNIESMHHHIEISRNINHVRESQIDLIPISSFEEEISIKKSKSKSFMRKINIRTSNNKGDHGVQSNTLKEHVKAQPIYELDPPVASFKSNYIV